MYEEEFKKLDKIFEEENAHLLTEDRDLYKGVFWIKNPNEPTSELFFPIPCDSTGNVVGDAQFNLNAKSGTTYNHERLWKNLSNKLTDNKEYNYYPRGRVEITNGKAIIYANPVLCTDEVKNMLIKAFNLIPFNGIKKVVMNADGSEHYKCHFDK